MTDIKNTLTNLNIRFAEDQPLSALSTFRIGGNAKLVCYPDTAEKTAAVVSFCAENGIEYLTFGRCSNVLFPDEGLDSLLIKTDEIDGLSLEDGLFAFGSGVPLCKATRFTVENSYAGMEFAYGIPGSVGGAVYMNAGAYGGDMSTCVVSAQYVDPKGEIRTVSDLEFSNRRSFFTDKNCIITKAYVKLEKGDPVKSEQLIEQYQTARKTKQPLDMPSAGSVFKRPEGYFAGRLIEECGLKGFAVGGASVSEKHAGFIVNNGSATAKDVKRLVEEIQNRVYDKFGVRLERELKYIGG